MKIFRLTTTLIPAQSTTTWRMAVNFTKLCDRLTMPGTDKTLQARVKGANLFKLCSLYEGILHNTGTEAKWAHIWK